MSASRVSATVPASAERSSNGKGSVAPSSASSAAVSVSSSSAPSARFTLLSYNLCLFPVGMRHSLRAASKDERVAEFVQHLKAAVRRRKEHPPQPEKHEQQEDAAKQAKGMRLRVANAASPTAAPAPALSPSAASALASRDPSSVLPVLLGADVVCVQEVFTSLWSRKWRDLVLAAASAPSLLAAGEHVSHPAADPDAQPAYPHVAWCRAPSLCRGHLLDSGLAVLSRHPIRFARFVPFQHNPGVMRAGDKGFIHACILLPPTRPGGAPVELHVLNTHLHSDEGSSSKESAERERAVQLREVRQYLLDEGLIRAAAAGAAKDGESDSAQDGTRSPSLSPDVYGAVAPEPSPEPLQQPTREASTRAAQPESPPPAVLLVGDLNIEQHSVFRERMQHTLGFPSLSALPPGEPTQHNSLPFCNHATLVASDYAVASSSVAFGRARIVKEAQHLSDHYPVLIEGSVNL